MQHDQDDYERIDSWLDKPTEIRLEVKNPFKIGFLTGLGFATAGLVFLMLFGGIGLALSSWMINSFMDSLQIEQQYEPNPELNP